jgi:predicted N-acetyltransferase YhbS
MGMGIEAVTDLQLRDMTAQDLPAALLLSREAKWPHRLEDLDLMLQVGEGLVAERDGQVVGTIMAWRYGPQVATLGMVIVSRACRGAGLGRRLMEAMLARLEPLSVQLNATQDGLALYKSLGFVAVGTVHQHQGAAFSPPVAKLRPDERVRPMGAREIAVVAELDRRASGFDRAGMFAALKKHARGVILDRGGEAKGFALFRRFGHGYVVGPAVAPDREGARTLISHWLGSNAGMFTRLDVPGDSGLTDWLQDLGLEAVDQVVTMVRGTLPERPGGVATFALCSQSLA